MQNKGTTPKIQQNNGKHKKKITAVQIFSIKLGCITYISPYGI